MKKGPLARRLINPTMKGGLKPTLSMLREGPWDAASSVLSSYRRGFLSIKVWCPTNHTGSRTPKQ
jgi:hypothetical protein